MPTIRYLRRAAAIAAVLLLLPLSACSKIPASTREEKTAVLSIDEYEVPYEQFRYFVRNYMDDYAAGDETYWTDARAAEMTDEIYGSACTELKYQYAILSLAKKYGIDRDNGAIQKLVDTEVKNTIEGYGGEEAYADDLAANHMTDSVFRFFTTVSVCREELYYAMLDAGDLENDTETLKKLIDGDEFIRVKQILIRNDEGESEKENLSRAEEAQRRAAAGENFDSLVSEYGEDLFMFQNPDGYYICRGVWYRAFEDTAFALEVGEVSDVVSTEAGYSILLRCPKEAAFIEKNFDDLCDDYRDAQFSLAIEKRASEITVTMRPKLDEYTLLTMD